MRFACGRRPPLPALLLLRPLPHVDEAKDDTERPEEAAESGAVDAVPVLRCDEVAEKG